jgi:hypothetical protein
MSMTLTPVKTRSATAWKKPIAKGKIKRLLVDLTNGCDMQHTGWPCGTCFFAAQPAMFTKEEWGEMWHAVLALRGDYDSSFKIVDGVEGYEMVREIEWNPDGTFKQHIFEFDPVSTYIPLLERLLRVKEES